MVFFITNIWTFLVVVALLIHLNWWLGLLTGAVFVPVFLLCMAFEKRYRVLSRRVQDEQGDLATYIEEAASGIRVLKALGRHREAEAGHGSRPTRCSAPCCPWPGCAARSGPGWTWCPMW